MFLEAEKSHNLLCARWRPRKTSGIIQSKYQGLRTGGGGRPLVYVLDSEDPKTRNSDVQRQEKIDIPAQEKRERTNLPFLHFFFFFFFTQALKGLDDAHPHR